ncbi:MAG UNVERIFIED_CONTAM: hypothetical protein LVR18_39515 [Planctomycetaceae bacterium]|jgi:putative N6-adenine-specific DNA methylase
MPQFDLIATTTFGLEAVVAREVQQLGYTVLRTVDGRVYSRETNAISLAATSGFAPPTDS